MLFAFWDFKLTTFWPRTVWAMTVLQFAAGYDLTAMITEWCLNKNKKKSFLTAVARSSSVAGVGAVAVESAPWLCALPSVFAVTGGAPGDRGGKKNKAMSSHVYTSVIIKITSRSSFINKANRGTQYHRRGSSLSLFSIYFPIVFFMCICFFVVV